MPSRSSSENAVRTMDSTVARSGQQGNPGVTGRYAASRQLQHLVQLRQHPHFEAEPHGRGHEPHQIGAWERLGDWMNEWYFWYAISPRPDARPYASVDDYYGALLYTDVTASLGGNTFLADAWGVDAATAGLQKCLAGPAGSSPITLSERAVEVIRSRGATIRSNYFDLAQILDYWGPTRHNHHTEATTMLYGARECARILLEEGVENAVDRHRGALRVARLGAVLEAVHPHRAEAGDVALDGQRDRAHRCRLLRRGVQGHTQTLGPRSDGVGPAGAGRPGRRAPPTMGR